MEMNDVFSGRFGACCLDVFFIRFKPFAHLKGPETKIETSESFKFATYFGYFWSLF